MNCFFGISGLFGDTGVTRRRVWSIFCFFQLFSSSFYYLGDAVKLLLDFPSDYIITEFTFMGKLFL